MRLYKSLRIAACCRTPAILQLFANRTALRCFFAHNCCPVQCQCIPACKHAVCPAAVRGTYTLKNPLSRPAGTEDEYTSRYHLWFKHPSRKYSSGCAITHRRDIGRTRLSLLNDTPLDYFAQSYDLSGSSSGMYSSQSVYILTPTGCSLRNVNCFTGFLHRLVL